MSIRMNVDGLEQVLRGIDRFNVDMTMRVRAAVREGGKELLKEARKGVKRDTGNLRRNIKLRVSRDGFTAWVTVRRAGFYGHFLEFGTIKMHAKPFMSPAAQNTRARYQIRMRNAVRGAST